jgi:dihydropyrimidinase
MKILIKSGTIITSTATRKADLLIDGEKITRIEPQINADDAMIIDAADKLIMPGGVDVHVHLDLPMSGTVSSDDHYTGGKAAAFGGTTTLIDFVPQDEGSLHENIQRWHAKADPLASIDYGFHMNITRFNHEVSKEILDLPGEGVSSIKVFTAYNGRLRLSDGDIFKVMRTAKDAGILTMLHAENGDVIDILVEEALAQGLTSPYWHAKTRPAWGAVEASLRAIALSAQADAPLYLVHMNTAGEVDQLTYAREFGLKVMGETCPQYLFFTEDDLKRPDGAKWICSPPMRTTIDNQRLWQGLETQIIQNVATDHCPFFFDGRCPINYEGNFVSIPGKELGKDDFTKIPNGLPGIADRLPIMWTRAVQEGRMTPNQFVEVMAANPARIFGIYPQKGTLQVGSDADVVIWDPNRVVKYGVKVAHHRTDYNLYEGWELKGFPETVFLRGERIVDHDAWFGKPGSGRYLMRESGEII